MYDILIGLCTYIVLQNTLFGAGAEMLHLYKILLLSCEVLKQKVQLNDRIGRWLVH